VTYKKKDFDTHLKQIKQIERVMFGDEFSLALNIGQLYYQIKDANTDLTELNKVLEEYEHPLFGELPPSTNVLHIELIHYIMEDLIDTIQNSEQAKIANEYYDRFKLTMFQSSKAEQKKYEKELSLRESLTPSIQMFLDEANFDLGAISPNSKKYYVVK
jgi:hypothetical protein